MKMQLHDAEYLPLYKRVSNFYIPAIFVITAILLEVTMFACMQVPFPSAYIYSLNIILIIAVMVAMLRVKWLQIVIFTLLLGGQLTTTISNIVANKTVLEIFSLETFNTFSTAFKNANSVDLSFGFLVPIILIIIFYITSSVLIMSLCKIPRSYRRKSRRAFFGGILAFFCFFSYTFTYSCGPDYRYGSDSYVTNLSNQKFLLDTFSNRVANLYSFGSYSYYLDNLIYLLGGKTDPNDVLGQGVKDFVPNNFALPDNEVLGEGYNLIMVLMETFERAAINPITMPNLYKFMQESCVDVNGYYSVERTCHSDYISQTGMNTWGQEWWSSYGEMPVQHSLANVFNYSGYTTMALHNYHGITYGRNKVFKPTLGFQTFNNYNTYDTVRYPKACAMNSDQLLFEKNLEKIAPSDSNFYSYVISASTHAISASWYDVHDYYPELAAYVEEPANWAELTKLYPVLLSGDQKKVLTAVNYLVGTYSFDLGFGALIDYMKTHKDVSGKKLIETTAIVMFGDHYYYVTPTVIKPENEDPRGLVGNRCPFIVYNPRAKTQDANGNIITQAENSVKENPDHCGTTLNRFTSTMDIYPTVCSLFGIQTDQQITYGHSIFDSSSESIGVGYLNAFTWGAVGYDEETDTWQIWRTLDFVKFDGITPNAEQMKTIEPLVNRTYASIFFNASMYKSNGFKSLKKYEAENAYKVGVIS